MRETNEFVLEWVIGDKRATCTVPEGTALNNQLTRLAGEYPDEVEICNSELFHVPSKWVKVRPPIKRDLTDEQLEQLRERMKNARAKQKENKQSIS